MKHWTGSIAQNLFRKIINANTVKYYSSFTLEYHLFATLNLSDCGLVVEMLEHVLLSYSHISDHFN